MFWTFNFTSLLIHLIIFILRHCVHIDLNFKKHEHSKYSMKVLVVREFIIVLNHTITFIERFTYWILTPFQQKIRTFDSTFIPPLDLKFETPDLWLSSEETINHSNSSTWKQWFFCGYLFPFSEMYFGKKILFFLKRNCQKNHRKNCNFKKKIGFYIRKYIYDYMK
jgi:hypothetical protein